MKKLIAFLLAIVMVLALAACAAQKAEQPAVSDAAAEPAADQNQTQEDAAASETPATQDEPVELEVWVCADSLEPQDTNNDGVVEYGMGTEKDLDKALEYYEKAALQGDEYAQADFERLTTKDIETNDDDDVNETYDLP